MGGDKPVRTMPRQPLLRRWRKTSAIGPLAVATTLLLPVAAVAQPVQLPRDMTVLGLFVTANALVKLVIVTLIVASVVTWWMWFSKSIRLRKTKRSVVAALPMLAQARSLADAAAHVRGKFDPVAVLVQTAYDEGQRSAGLRSEGLKERISWRLERIEAAAGERVGRGMGVIAVIGVTSPLVGLLGTVWSIMDSFIGISMVQAASLVLVAQAVAEALFATALGLFAAIPAAAIYIVLVRSIGRYRALLTDASAAVLQLVSRDLDRPQSP